MENKLSFEQERLVGHFSARLELVYGVDDIFPPDALSGMHEPRRPILPTLGQAATCAFAPVYELSAYRDRRFVSYGGLFPDAA